MPGGLLLMPVYTLVVAAPSGPDQGCPSPRQVTEALNARMTDLVTSGQGQGNEGSNPGGLRLVVSGGVAPEPLKIELLDPAGETRLLRSLPPVPREHSSDCSALAETVALIVDRYLHEVGYELPLPPPPAPPPPPPPAPEPEPKSEPRPGLVARPPPAPVELPAHRFDLLAGGYWRDASAESELETELGIGLEQSIGTRRVGATFTGGLAPSQTAGLPGGTAKLRRFPLHFGLFLALPAGPGWVEPGAGLGVDWLVTSVQWTRGSASYYMRASPNADLALGYRVPLVGGLFFRGTASLNLAVPYQFVPPASSSGPAGTTPIFTTPRMYVKAGLELGFSFQ